MFKQSLKPYEKYNPVNYDHIKQLPEGWELLPNIAVFDERVNKGHTDEELLSISSYKGIIKSSDYEDKKDRTSDNKSEYLLVEYGDLAYNTMLMWAGAIGSSEFRGIVSPAYTVLKPKIKINHKFFHYQYRTDFYQNYSKRFSYGIIDSRLRLYFVNFKRMYSIVPPFEIQNRIVEYLNHKTKQADTFIEKQTRLVELLKEQKKAIINNAVTKGLNPDAPMKDSGIEWLGEIPAHWNILKAKYIFKEIDEHSKTGKEELLSVSHITGVTPRSEKNVYMFMAEDYSGSKLCKKDDLVINIMWAWMGALGISDRTGIVSPSYCVYRQKKTGIFNSWYLENLLRSVEYIAEYNRRSTGLHSSRLRLYTHMFFDMEIAIPPIEEQNEIEQTVKSKTAKIDQAIEKAEKEIILVKEYLQSLIYHVVTGQLKID